MADSAPGTGWSGEQRADCKEQDRSHDVFDGGSEANHRFVDAILEGVPSYIVSYSETFDDCLVYYR